MGNNLRGRRRSLEISQHDLAAAVDLHRDRYWRIEKGYTEPTDVEREALAKALDATVDDLFPATHDTAEVAS